MQDTSTKNDHLVYNPRQHANKKRKVDLKYKDVYSLAKLVLKIPLTAVAHHEQEENRS